MGKSNKKGLLGNKYKLNRQLKLYNYLWMDKTLGLQTNFLPLLIQEHLYLFWIFNHTPKL